MKTTNLTDQPIRFPRGVSVRKATLADIEILERYEAAYFGLDQFSRRQLQYLLTRPTAVTYLLEHGAKPAGAATVVIRKNSGSAKLYSIVVEAAARGKGYGALLMDVCEAHACQHGCSKMILEVRIDNDRAIALYEHRGYRAIGRLPLYYADGADAWRMQKKLAPRIRRATSFPSASNSPD